MKILFTLIGNSRRSNYLTGDNLRYGGGGGSGTDTSTILVAEYLASKGHEVVVVVDKLEPMLEEKYKRENNNFVWGQKSKKVQYSNLDFENVSIKEFDILVNSLWFDNYEKLPVKITKALIYWCHMQWLYGMDQIINFVNKNNLKLGVVHISEWEKRHNSDTVKAISNSLKNVATTLIPNPIADEIVEEVEKLNITRKPHKFIFHASFARGGNVAVQAVRELNFPGKEFHAFDYLMAIHNHSDSFFFLHNGVDKFTLFKHLAESEYFIYPLYTPYEDVHKDTFSCAVAEAIALGTIVISYPLGALPENFNNHVQWLELPPGADVNIMQNESLSKDPEGKFKCTKNIIDKINFLESNPQIKQSVRETGKHYIIKNFNVQKIGALWEDFLLNLIK